MRARRPARHRLRVGGRAPLPRGVQPLERARGVPRRGVAAHEAHPARARHRADAAAVQPSGARRRAHRDARPRVERPGRLRHRRVVVGGRARRRSCIDPTREARDVGGGPARRGALHDRGAVHRARRRVRHDAAAQRRARSRARSRTRRCGSRAAGATRSTSPRRRASARSRSRSSTPRRRSTGSTTTTRRSRREGVPIGDAVNANIACVTTFMCHDDEDEALRARPRRRELLRLLARALLRVRSPPARARPTCGPSTSSARAEHGLRPGGGAGRGARTRTGSAPRSSQEGVGGLRGAVGTPDQIREYLRRYEECGVDQVIFC